MSKIKKFLKSKDPMFYSSWVGISRLCSVGPCMGRPRFDHGHWYSLCTKHEVQYRDWSETVYKSLFERIHIKMADLRETVRNVLRSKEDRILTDTGFTYSTGTLTVEGRKVVLDILFERDAELKKQVVAVANKIKEDSCDKKKK